MVKEHSKFILDHVDFFFKGSKVLVLMKACLQAIRLHGNVPW